MALVVSDNEFAAGLVHVKNLASGKKTDVARTGGADSRELVEAIRRIMNTQEAAKMALVFTQSGLAALYMVVYGGLTNATPGM